MPVVAAAAGLAVVAAQTSPAAARPGRLRGSALGSAPSGSREAALELLQEFCILYCNLILPEQD